MPQSTGSANLSSIANRIIRSARYTQEANAPSWQLIEKIPLPKGASTVRWPKFGTFTISDLVDGQDMVDEQTLGMTFVDLTATERGAKIVLTDKLVREWGTTDAFSVIGRQFGEAAARKQDRDTNALYGALSGSSRYGAAGTALTLALYAAGIARSRGGSGSSAAGNSTGVEPFDPTYAVLHPHQSYQVTRTATAIGAGTSMRVNDMREEKMLTKFFKFSFNGVDAYESKNINIDSSGDAIGVLAQRDALVGLTSVGWRTERERDASARGTEVNFVSDYGVSELDDRHGAGLLYDAAAPAVS
jgi:hypothetical protein